MERAPFKKRRKVSYCSNESLRRSSRLRKEDEKETADVSMKDLLNSRFVSHTAQLEFAGNWASLNKEGLVDSYDFGQTYFDYLVWCRAYKPKVTREEALGEIKVRMGSLPFGLKSHLNHHHHHHHHHSPSQNLSSSLPEDESLLPEEEEEPPRSRVFQLDKIIEAYKLSRSVSPHSPHSPRQQSRRKKRKSGEGGFQNKTVQRQLLSPSSSSSLLEPTTTTTTPLKQTTPTKTQISTPTYKKTPKPIPPKQLSRRRRLTSLPTPSSSSLVHESLVEEEEENSVYDEDNPGSRSPTLSPPVYFFSRKQPIFRTTAVYATSTDEFLRSASQDQSQSQSQSQSQNLASSLSQPSQVSFFDNSLARTLLTQGNSNTPEATFLDRCQPTPPSFVFSQISSQRSQRFDSFSLPSSLSSLPTEETAIFSASQFEKLNPNFGDQSGDETDDCEMASPEEQLSLVASLKKLPLSQYPRTIGSDGSETEDWKAISRDRKRRKRRQRKLVHAPPVEFDDGDLTDECENAPAEIQEEITNYLKRGYIQGLKVNHRGE